jgi:hypothetical protein
VDFIEALSNQQKFPTRHQHGFARQLAAITAALAPEPTPPIRTPDYAMATHKNSCARPALDLNVREGGISFLRHDRAWPGHPGLSLIQPRNSWVAEPSPAMTHAVIVLATTIVTALA